MRAAFDLCLQLGVPHPDYLLGRDSLDDFNVRGLTSRQWGDWLAYLRIIPMPIDRIDFAFANLRGDVRRDSDYSRLLPNYGRPRRQIQSEDTLRESLGGVVAAENLRRGRTP